MTDRQTYYACWQVAGKPNIFQEKAVLKEEILDCVCWLRVAVSANDTFCQLNPNCPLMPLAHYLNVVFTAFNLLPPSGSKIVSNLKKSSLADLGQSYHKTNPC